MWKNFAKALLLLSIAMAAALYSSSAGREGRLAATGISALIALGIAVWVGFRFVPRLARGVDWKWASLVSRHKITSAGWIYLGAVFVVVFAAVNTSNNLLYMVLSALLSVLLLSGFFSALNFRSLKLQLRLPVRCFAGEHVQISVRIENQKRVFPALSLDVQPAPGSGIHFEPLYFAAVHARTSQPQSGLASFPQRGLYVVDRLTVESRYPFGFFSKARDHVVRAECVCYPALLPKDEVGAFAADIHGSSPRSERGTGSDLYMIRDYISSDSGRHVHWKASAKTGTLKTREYALEESRRIMIAFDRFGHPEDSERFEQLVSHAASLAFHWIQDGAEVTLVSDEWATPERKSSVLLDSILNYLAVVQMSPSARMPDMDTMNGAVLLSLRQRRGHVGEHN